MGLGSGFPGGLAVKNLPAMQETWVGSQSKEDPLEEGTATHPVFLPGKFHGQWSLVGYGAWGRKELDTNEATDHACKFRSGFMRNALNSLCVFETQ